MPGANCGILGCNRSRKNSGVSIFALPKGEDDLLKKVQGEWVKQLKRAHYTFVKDILKKDILKKREFCQHYG